MFSYHQWLMTKKKKNVAEDDVGVEITKAEISVLIAPQSRN